MPGMRKRAPDQAFAFRADDRVILRQHRQLGIFAQVALKGRQLAETTALLGAYEQFRRPILDPACQLLIANSPGSNPRHWGTACRFRRG